jgi:hypothetical protein
MMIHLCNLNYLGGRSRKDLDFRPADTESGQQQKTNTKRSGCCGSSDKRSQVQTPVPPPKEEMLPETVLPYVHVLETMVLQMQKCHITGKKKDLNSKITPSPITFSFSGFLLDSQLRRPIRNW